MAAYSTRRRAENRPRHPVARRHRIPATEDTLRNSHVLSRTLRLGYFKLVDVVWISLSCRYALRPLFELDRM